MGGVVDGLVVDGRGVVDGPDVVGRDVVGRDVGAGGVAVEGLGWGVAVEGPALGGIVALAGGLVPALGEEDAAGDGPATPQPPAMANNATSSMQREPSLPPMRPVCHRRHDVAATPRDCLRCGFDFAQLRRPGATVRVRT